MSEPQDLPQQIKQFGAIFWIHAAWRAMSGVIIVVGAGLPTAMMGWEKMQPSEKKVAIVCLIIAGWKSLDMSFNEAMRRVAQGKTPAPLNGDSHTQHFQKPPEVGK